MLFFLPIVIGILIGMGFSVFTVKYFLETYPVPTYFLFIGFIVGMLPFIWKSGYSLYDDNHTYRSYHFVIMIFFFLLIASLDLVNTQEQAIILNLAVKDYIYLFLSGWLASIALVLPGMSGALILMILGAYYTALNALLTFDIGIILTVGLGIFIGILITGKFVQIMLRKYHQSTYAAIIGLLCGSVVVLYPSLPLQVAEFSISILALVIGFISSYIVSHKKTCYL